MATAHNKIVYKSGAQIGNVVYLHDVNGLINRRHAMFKCSCGNKFIAQIYKVKIFETQSCGCLHRKMTSLANSRHNLKGHKLYGVWSAMKARCYNPSTTQYADYGGRGVIVCDKWRNDFMSFFRWAMLNGWREGLQLDKDINGDGMIYSPETCQFVTAKVNSNKRRSSKYIEYNGEKRTISEWATFFKISQKNLYQRLSRGWSIDKCFGNA